MNYVLEGNINFSDELIKLLSKEEDNNNNDDICLISGDKLTNNFIKLDCGHSFNYECLFNELINQRKVNRLETQKTTKYQIKCPYCRRNHKGILPWYEGYKKINFVNWSESNVKVVVKCQAILKSGNRKGEKCGCNAKFGNYCGKHKKYYLQLTN